MPGILPYCHYVIGSVDLRRRRRCCSYRVRQSYISRTVWPRITEFYRHIHADLPNIGTGYDATNCFRSEATENKLSKMPLQTASGGISRQRFMRVSPNFTRLSWITGPTNLLDITSTVASGRLQNAINYWTKVMRKAGPVGQRVK